MDPPPRRSGRLGSTEIKSSPAGSGPARSAPRPRDRGAATQRCTVVAKGRQIRPRVDWILLDLDGSSTPPLRTARIHRDQVESSGIWAGSIGAAPETVALLLRAPLSKGRQIRPRVDWILLDLARSSTPPLRTARIHLDQVESSGIWADSIGAAPPRPWRCYSEHRCRRGVRSDPELTGSY